MWWYVVYVCVVVVVVVVVVHHIKGYLVHGLQLAGPARHYKCGGMWCRYV